MNEIQIINEIIERFKVSLEKASIGNVKADIALSLNDLHKIKKSLENK